MKKTYKPLSLNEANVNCIYEECFLPARTTSFITTALYKKNPNFFVDFDSKKIYEHSHTIRYLLGQLYDVHMGKREFGLKTGIIRYDKVPWTKNTDLLIRFYFLGIAANLLSPIDDETKILTISESVFPSLLLDDSNFEEWYRENGKKFEPKVDTQS